ncbi:MAG: MerR family transcriptional regulator [Limibacillus sp.]
MATAKSNGKSAAAFRTISEVADELDVPQHVLRFWESKFSQVTPLKRGGGRRYYRPEDVELLRKIRDLLYQDGYTIKGVQKLLREGQVKKQDLAPDTAASTAKKAASSGAKAESKRSAEAGLAPEKKRELKSMMDELEALRSELNSLSRD